MGKKQKRQKYKKQKQKQRNTWIFLAIGGLALIFATFLFARQGSGDDSGGTPAIAVDQQQIDFGDVKFNTNKTFAVKVTNTGDGTLRFKEKPFVQVLEGC